jgi:hypothetical protein
MLDFCCCGAVLTLVQPVEPEELKKIKSLPLLSSTPLPSLSSGPRGPRRLLESRSSSASFYFYCRLDPNLLAKKASGDYSQDFRHQVKKHWFKPVQQRIPHRPFHRLHQVGRPRPGAGQREGGRQPTRQGGGSRLTQLIRRWHVRRLGLIGRTINLHFLAFFCNFLSTCLSFGMKRKWWRIWHLLTYSYSSLWFCILKKRNLNMYLLKYNYCT